MKATTALRLLTALGLSSFGFATKSSAQLFFHIVATNGLPGVSTSENTGVAADVRFDFNWNGISGLLRVTINNLSGTGSYTNGIVTGFGFDLPGSLATPNTPVISYAGGPIYYQTSFNDPSGINFTATAPYTQTNPVGNFDFGAEAVSPAPHNGLAGGATGIFEFQFNGTNAGNFSESTFFRNNGSDADIGLRFQGLPNGQSEKVAYVVDDTISNTPPPIPEPSTYGAMAAVLLLGVAGLKRRRALRSAAK